MSMMMEAAKSDAQAIPGPFQSNATAYRIKRLGARPLSFDGSEMAMAMSFTPAIPYWYEVNIYRTTSQIFVLVIRMFFQSADEQDYVRAWECDSLADALDLMESYDAGQDVKVTFDPAQPMVVAELTARAMELHARTAAMRAHYAGLVGEFFYDLETA